MTSSRSAAVARMVAFATAIALTASASVGYAQAHVPTAQELETARSLYKEGKDLRAAGDLRGAIEKLRAAHALGNTPVTGIELARTYVLAGKLVEAREVALQVARIAVAGDETEKSADARAEAAKLADDLRPRIATLAVKIGGVGAGETAHLAIDGVAVPDVALGEPQKIDPGKHDVAVRVGDGAAAREAHATADATEGQAVEVSVDVPPAPAALPPSTGPAPPPTPTPEEPHGMPAVAKVAFGVAIAGAVVGLYGGVTALEDKGLLANECNPSKQCDNSKNGTSDLDSARTWATVSTVSFVVAAVGLATGIVALVLDRPRSQMRPDGTLVSPWFGVGVAGVHGSF